MQIFAQLTNRLNLRHGTTFNGARDLQTTLGYKDQLTYQDYYARYKRGGIAKTIIDAFVDDTWRLPPSCATSINRMRPRLPPLRTPGTARQTAPSVARHSAPRSASPPGALCGPGAGPPGADKLRVKAAAVRNAEDLLYLQAFSEEHCEIVELVTDDESPLFGTPHLYSIDFSRGQGDLLFSPTGTRPQLAGQYAQKVLVHASRCIHVAEGGLEDDLIGAPALEAVWNLLDDLDKLVGGTSEMVWKDAKRRLVAELREGATLSPEDAELFSERIQQFMHQMMDVLQVQNIDVRQLEGRVPDASNNVTTVLDLIWGPFACRSGACSAVSGASWPVIRTKGTGW